MGPHRRGRREGEEEKIQRTRRGGRQGEPMRCKARMEAWRHGTREGQREGSRDSLQGRERGREGGGNSQSSVVPQQQWQENGLFDVRNREMGGEGARKGRAGVGVPLWECGGTGCGRLSMFHQWRTSHPYAACSTATATTSQAQAAQCTMDGGASASPRGGH